MTSPAKIASGWKTGGMLEVKWQTNQVPTLSIEALVQNAFAILIKVLTLQQHIVHIYRGYLQYAVHSRATNLPYFTDLPHAVQSLNAIAVTVIHIHENQCSNSIRSKVSLPITYSAWKTFGIMYFPLKCHQWLQFVTVVTESYNVLYILAA